MRDPRLPRSAIPILSLTAALSPASAAAGRCTARARTVSAAPARVLRVHETIEHNLPIIHAVTVHRRPKRTAALGGGNQASSQLIRRILRSRTANLGAFVLCQDESRSARLSSHRPDHSSQRTALERKECS